MNDPITDVSNDSDSDKFLIDKDLVYRLEQLTSGFPAVNHIILKKLEEHREKIDAIYDRQNIQIKNREEERNLIYREFYVERDLNNELKLELANMKRLLEKVIFQVFPEEKPSDKEAS